MPENKKYCGRKILVLLLSVILVILILIYILNAAVFSKTNQMQQNKQEWNLLLVNNTYGIPKDYKIELTELSNGKSVDSRIYPDLQAMFDDMRSVGIYPVVSEGYRTAAEQEAMMDDKVKTYINEGCSKNKAKQLAAQTVAKVDHSEHQLGLAVDINGDENFSSNEDVYAWLAENAYKYGFILRYPQDKQNITGFEFEPWHYRYVGIIAATEIHSKEICLEEYLNEDDKAG